MATHGPLPHVRAEWLPALLDQQKVAWAERGYTVSADNAFMLRGHHAQPRATT